MLFWFSLLFPFFLQIFNLLLSSVFPSLFSLPVFSQRKQVSCLIKCFHILNFADCISWCHFKCVPIPLFLPQWWLNVEASPDLGLMFWQDYFTNGMVYSHKETHVIWLSLCGPIIEVWIQANFIYINYTIFKSYTVFLNSITLQQHLFWFVEGISLF